jgi:hypothetical protein
VKTTEPPAAVDDTRALALTAAAQAVRTAALYAPLNHLDGDPDRLTRVLEHMAEIADQLERREVA